MGRWPLAREEIALIGGGAIFNLGAAALLLAIAGSDSDGTELALRTTARISYVWFMLAFIASPLHKLRPSRISDWLVRRRRALGVTFGLSMSIHVGFILRLFALHAPERPPMVTDEDFTIGIPGLIFVALLTVTSFEALRRRMTERAWTLLHRTGIWVVWAIFFLCLVDSVGRKDTGYPVLAYHLFIAGLLAAMSLRIAATRLGARRPSADRGP